MFNGVITPSQFQIQIQFEFERQNIPVSRQTNWNSLVRLLGHMQQVPQAMPKAAIFVDIPNSS